MIGIGGWLITINQGCACRFEDLWTVGVVETGATNISRFEVGQRSMPIKIDLIECHPLGSHAFYPLQDEEWLVLVCADPLKANSYRCFRAIGQQGVNYARNIWHFPLLVFEPSRFIVVDRKGTGVNLEEVKLSKPLSIAV